MELPCNMAVQKHPHRISAGRPQDRSARTKAGLWHPRKTSNLIGRLRDPTQGIRADQRHLPMNSADRPQGLRRIRFGLRHPLKTSISTGRHQGLLGAPRVVQRHPPDIILAGRPQELTVATKPVHSPSLQIILPLDFWFSGNSVSCDSQLDPSSKPALNTSSVQSNKLSHKRIYFFN